MDVHDRGIQVRSEAIRMLKAGITQINVARKLQVTIRTVKIWCSSYRDGQSLETKSRSGRPHKLNRANKIVFAKSLGKNRQSTRKIAQRITNTGNLFLT